VLDVEVQTTPHAPQFFASFIRLEHVPVPEQSPYPDAQTQVLLPPQTWFVPQPPHESVPPQPSGIVPQVFPCAAQVVGVQHEFDARHTCPVGQPPQETVPPQPSDALPQAIPSVEHVAGRQLLGDCVVMLPIWSYE
jgi:hypothetical protein